MAKNMPVEARAEIVDSLLESMQPTDSRIDELWKAEVERRIDEYENGNVDLIPGEAVFAKINKRLSK